VCGNAVGVIGSPQASCGGDQESSPSGGGGTVQGGGSGSDGGGNPPDEGSGNPPADGGGNPPPADGGGNPPAAEGGGSPVTGDAQEVSTALEAQALASPATQAFTGDHLLAFMLLAVVMFLLGTLLWAWGTLEVDRA
jgi:hypothetical protein